MTADRSARRPTPGCIVKVKKVSLAFECSAEPTHVGLLLINDQVFLAFACLEHKSMLIAARRMLDRDRAELERRRHSWTWARVGHPPLPIEPLRTGAAAHRLVAKARAWQTASRRGDLVTRRSGTQIAPTPARAASASSFRNASAKADSLCCRWPWKAFPSGQTAAAVGELAMGAPLPIRG
jgi:hypothetical protein